MAISLSESVMVGLTDFWSRKVRSVVTILGIVLGTMSIIVVLALTKGMKEQSQQWILKRGGLDKVTVRRNWEYENKKGLREGLTLPEIRFIREALPGIRYFNATEHNWGRLSKGDKQMWSQVQGVYPDFVHIQEWNVSRGRFLNEQDIAAYANVICIGTNVAENIFGNADPIGKTLHFQGVTLTVIGIMEEKFMETQSDTWGENALDWMNDQCMTPLSTMLKKMEESENIQGFEVKAEDPGKSLELKKQLDNILLNLRRNEPMFMVEWAEESAKAMAGEFMIFNVIFMVVAVISLLVGGIVIMNIMLATIKERTREIGIRLAVGARRVDVFTQFLVQTVLVTLIGGAVGIVAGFSIIDTVSNFMRIRMSASPDMVFIALGVSAGVGLFFGIFPAIQAANLDPVKALQDV